MFEEGFQHSTICNYRSAISAFHEGCDGVSVGKHPLVSNLITGVFNERPPQPKSGYVWDVQVVFEYLRKVSNYHVR